ncbi:MAG TPA: hypothetical protein VNM14_24350 [Planctomycetota bacterium]|nr:hypothetical protein [Planctomycetota bacterium]
MLKRRTRRKYVVKEVQEAPRLSHLSQMFPECIYTLIRQEDGKSLRLLLRRSTGWKAGDTLELDEYSVKAACLPG